MFENASTTDFFARIEHLAQYLMLRHGLKDWKFGWDRAKKRYGLCHFGRKCISLSIYLTPLCSEKEIQNTILHEIAHALVGVNHGHDKVWKAKALEIGCDAMRCGKAVVLPKTFVGSCPKCSQKVYRNRRSRASCAKCSPKFNPKYLIVWQRNSS
jgi:predicted SprT family Zn-dependent metalloprotease